MPIDPKLTYVQLSADGSASPVPGGAQFWGLPDEAMERHGQAWLISEFECSSDWPNWEMHPNADEFVYLLAGAVDLLLEEAAGLQCVELRGCGAVIVRRGIWHTARVHAPSRMLHVTLGAGTQHRAAGTA